eukprot:TRINITY_DN1574_c0_g1_i1.p1 TRINITY_DN1574_c0_g1~~TRINITY_DN1574_c0_g1_i1.p1  ORF type:complete len:285 (-),score=108.58 TRINITY_DN1574_c0_g1_i1:58-912(-)
MDPSTKIAILGCGNIGLAIAKGIAFAGLVPTENITITRKSNESIAKFRKENSEPFVATTDNLEAVKNSTILVLGVTPQSLNDLLSSIRSSLRDDHLLISVISGAEISDIRSRIGNDKVEIVRAMPNTAIAFRQSMTCIAFSHPNSKAVEPTKQIFDALGSTLVVSEEQMVPATALCACGIAFFLRAIRAAAQGGIEIGFHSEDAIKLAAQTAKGAAELILSGGNHPEREVDKVTTPQGCTISGLNMMEHNGFSSAFIKGIVTSAEKAAILYKAKKRSNSVTEEH